VPDGDELRQSPGSDLGFSDVDRAEAVRRTAERARLLNAQGLYGSWR
jgi:adenylylsulfate kinase